MILLIQFRTDQSGWHELKCFFEASGKNYNDFAIVNAYTPELNWEAVKAMGELADHIIVGGSGESGYENADDTRFFTMIEQLKPVMRHWLELGKPLLGICLGHQIMADTIGGVVRPDPQFAETGTIKINLDDAVKNDPVFGSLPRQFVASTAHKTSVLELPPTATVYAKTPHAAIQIYRYKSAYGVQFHPELDEHTLEFRLSLYSEYKAYQKPSSTDHDFSSARSVLQNFLR